MAVPVLVELREIADRLNCARRCLKFGSAENMLLADTSIQLHDLTSRITPVNPTCLRALAGIVIEDLMRRGWEQNTDFYRVAAGLVSELYLYARLIEDLS